MADKKGKHVIAKRTLTKKEQEELKKKVITPNSERI